MISIIAIMSRNRVIGQGGNMPPELDIPSDKKRFARITRTGTKTVIVGRKTQESIGRKLGEPLKGRRTMMLTRNPLQYTSTGDTIVYDDPLVLLGVARSVEGEIFVIGGEEVYRLFLPYADKIYLTIVDVHLEGDAFFPEWNQDEWSEVEREDVYANININNERHNYKFLTLRRKPKPVYIEMENVRGEEQRRVMQKILEKGHCPFCEENLLLYHNAPIHWKGGYWIVTENQWPYSGKGQHLMLILCRHAVSPTELRAEEWAELGEHVTRATQQFGFKGGAVAMRFGNMLLSGASIAHLHVQLIEPSPDAPEPLRIFLGPKQKTA